MSNPLMSTKHIREINRRIQALPQSYMWDWEWLHDNHSHHVLLMEYNDRVWKIRVSSSPKNLDHCIDNAIQDVKRVIQYATIQHEAGR